MKGHCYICDTEIEIQMCCSGRDCGCMGMPVEPAVCSEECFIIFKNEFEQNAAQPKPLIEFSEPTNET